MSPSLGHCPERCCWQTKGHPQVLGLRERLQRAAARHLESPRLLFRGVTKRPAWPSQTSVLSWGPHGPGPHVSAPNVGSDAPAHACPSAADSPPPERGPSSTLGKYLRDLLKDSELC